MRRLLRIRVRPYYLFQTDLVRGTSHFWTVLDKGIEIMKALQGHVSGLGVPRFMIDLPAGGGKIPITPSYLIGRQGDELLVNDYLDQERRVPFLGQEARDGKTEFKRSKIWLK